MSDLRRPLLLLAVAGFVSGMTIRVAEPMLPKVASDLQVSVGAASVLITGFTLAYGLFQIVHGPLGDRIGKLRGVAGALLLAAIACGACAFATSLQSLAVLRFLTGMTAGAVIPLSFAFVGDNVPFADRQPVLGRFISGVLLGQTLGPLLGGAFSDFIGWRATFMVPAVAFALIGLLLLPLARAEQTPERVEGEGPIASYRNLLRSPSVRIICLAVGLEGMLFYGAFAYLGAYLRHDFELSYTVIGLLLAGFGVGGVIYSALVKVLVGRLGQARMVAWGAWLLLLGFAVLAALPVWPLAVPTVVLLGLAFYMFHNTLQTRATEMGPRARGAAISIFAFALFFGQAIGVSTAALGVETLGYRPVIALAGLGLSVLGLWFSRRLATL
ncbi:MAG: MFS transporter [Ectothiorhodospiraceae bacterium]|nr:MFS transporter [Ectothiorhodospiraceae bacterium]